MRSLISWYQGKLEELQFNRIGTMMFMFLFHGNVTAPLTLLVLFKNGADPVQFFICVLGSFAVIIPNLSVAPVRITIPIFVFSTLIHLSIIVLNLVS